MYTFIRGVKLFVFQPDDGQLGNGRNM